MRGRAVPDSRPNHEGVSREWAEQKFGKLALWPSYFDTACSLSFADSLSRSAAAESDSTQCTLCPRTYLPSNMLPTQHGNDFSAPFPRGYTEISRLRPFRASRRRFSILPFPSRFNSTTHQLLFCTLSLKEFARSKRGIILGSLEAGMAMVYDETVEGRGRSLTRKLVKNIGVNASTKEINGYQQANHPRLR